MGMEAFGILGFVFGLIAFARVAQLEKRLRRNGLLTDGDQ